MIRRALWIGGATLALTACGPMPGYMAPSERHQPRETRPGVEYKSASDESTSDQPPPTRDDSELAPEDDSAEPSSTASPPRTVLRDPRTTRDLPSPAMPPAPSAAPEPPARVSPPPDASLAASPSKLQVVPLDRADSYYLIDRERGLCFFIHKESSAKVDCSSIPEGRDVASPAPTPPAAPAVAPPVRDDQGVRRRYLEPAPPAAPVPPARSSTTAAPAPAADPDGPTGDELNRFEGAYTDIACDRRQGSFTPPRQRIEASGLTLERYTAIEGWLTSDERAWRLLVTRAYRECDARK